MTTSSQACWYPSVVARPCGRLLLTLWATSLAGFPGSPLYKRAFDSGDTVLLWQPRAAPVADADPQFKPYVFRAPTFQAADAGPDSLAPVDSAAGQVGLHALPPTVVASGAGAVGRALVEGHLVVRLSPLGDDAVPLMRLLEAQGVVDCFCVTNPVAEPTDVAADLDIRVSQLVVWPAVGADSVAAPAR